MSAVTTPSITGRWQLDPIHSSIGFAVRHMGVSTFRGRLGSPAGRLEISDGHATLRGSVAVAALEVPSEDLKRHLLTEDFFDADRHPAITFESRALGLAGTSVSVKGSVTIRGVTKPIEASGHLDGPAADLFGGERLGLALEASLDREDFGLHWKDQLPNGLPALGATVRIAAELEFVRS